MSLKLRNYQVEAMDRLYKDLFTFSAILCAMPTGCGKTEIMMALLQKCLDVRPDMRAVVLLNKVKLVQQTARRFSKSMENRPIGVYCGTEGLYQVDRAITIASIQSIYNVAMDKVNLIILDEVHGVDQEEGRYLDFIESLKASNEKLKIIGFTATPFRSTGYIYGKGKLFQKVNFRKTLPEMIEQGFLVPPRLKRVDHQFDTRGLQVRAGEFMPEQVERLTGDRAKVTAQVIDALKRAEGRSKIVWACSSIAHAKLVHEILVSGGERASLLHSQMNETLRKWNTDRFEGYDLDPARHLVFITIVSEGYDYPPIDTVVLMRPMRSAVLYVQTVGRGLRPSEGKDFLLVLDYGRVVETLGPLDRPFVPDGGSRAPTPEENPMKFCPNCLEYVLKTVRECPICQHQFFTPRDLSGLEDRASEVGSLLAKPPAPPKIHTVRVRGVSICQYESKSGNLCLRVDYDTLDLLNPTLSEYFVWSNEFAQRRALRRLIDLDVPLAPRLEQIVQHQPKKCPSELTYLAERYPRVTKLSFANL